MLILVIIYCIVIFNKVSSSESASSYTVQRNKYLFVPINIVNYNSTVHDCTVTVHQYHYNQWNTIQLYHINHTSIIVPIPIYTDSLVSYLATYSQLSSLGQYNIQLQCAHHTILPRLGYTIQYNNYMQQHIDMLYFTIYKHKRIKRKSNYRSDQCLLANELVERERMIVHIYHNYKCTGNRTCHTDLFATPIPELQPSRIAQITDTLYKCTMESLLNVVHIIHVQSYWHKLLFMLTVTVLAVHSYSIYQLATINSIAI